MEGHLVMGVVSKHQLSPIIEIYVCSKDAHCDDLELELFKDLHLIREEYL